jgi:DNA-binding MarR family transcriptional regulator
MRTAAAPTHDHERFVAAFLDRVRRDRGLPANAYKVASIIAEHLNRRTRVAWPGRTRIAELASLSDATVKRMITKLCEFGHLEVERGQGRGHSSRYRLLDGSQMAAEKGSAPAQEKGSIDAEKGSIREIKGVSTDPQPSEDLSQGCAYAHPLGLGRENAPVAREQSPSGAGADAPAGQEGEEARAPAESVQPIRPAEPHDASAGEPEIQSSAVASLDAERAFRELRGLWRRGWPADDAPKVEAITRRAYYRAIQEGADPEAILAGARNWVAAADAPRFLEKLWEWLAARGWQSTPPIKSRSSRGHGATPRGRSERRGKPNLFKIALKAGGYRETPDGRMVFGGAQ